MCGGLYGVPPPPASTHVHDQWGVDVAQDTGDVETIDAPLQPDDEDLVRILDEPLAGRRSREDDVVAGEASPPAADSEFFTAPLLEENDNEMGR
jgi:hypothetical protein